ncbi:MAG TPA: hypothetical protein VHC19_23180 [Pirellulales bacterium]|nr:hypothetical protein [Pirellulales bacterium]
MPGIRGRFLHVVGGGGEALDVEERLQVAADRLLADVQLLGQFPHAGAKPPAG